MEVKKINQELGKDERLGRSRETIRQKVLNNNYNAWFSWECDQILPKDTLTKLVEIMKAGDFAVISNLDQSEFSGKPLDNPIDSFGSALVNRKALEKYGFLLEYPNMPDCWYKGGKWFKKQVIKSGGKYLEVDTKNINRVAKFRGRKNLKLNIGCGDKHKKGYINIDILEPCDLKHDLRTPWPFDNNSVDEIFSEGNTVCLFSKKEWFDLKKEIARVLKIGGKLELIFFDLEYIFKAFLDDKKAKRWDYWWRTIFSAQKDKYDYSKNGFTYEKMVSDLSGEGMTGFTKLKPPEPGYIHLICFKYKLPRTKSPRHSRLSDSTSLFTASLHPRIKNPRYSRSLNRKP